mgnify:CR=1 FL=1
MSPAVHEIPAVVLTREELERKIYTPYSRTASYEQFLEYRSEGDTRVEINGSRHYKTPYGALPSVTTILSATGGNKAALERWAKKNPGGREAAAALLEMISGGSPRTIMVETHYIVRDSSAGGLKVKKK